MWNPSWRKPSISSGNPRNPRQRLDLLLVHKGLVESREKARALIMAGDVEVEGVRADKPGHAVPVSAEIRLRPSSPPYVSRGGLKLAEALKRFPVDVRDRTILDVGASTGGFTDCLLQSGAGRVIAVDVGRGQFHWRLRNDPRVRLLERTNVRHLEAGALGEPVHGAVIDVSFISLRMVVPVVGRILEPDAFIIALVKPQFEVGRERVGKGGVVREPALHEEVVETLSAFFEDEGWPVRARADSPILGPKGNREFLLHLERAVP